MPARGVDAPPGSQGSAPSLILPDITSSSAPPRFQNVLVIAPAPGARCRGSFGSEASWMERERIANEAREVVLHMEMSWRSPTIICSKDGETWKRKLSRLVLREWPEREIRTADGKTHKMRANKVRGYSPILHVPGPDAEAPLRWDRWQRASCVAPKDAMLTLVCRDALATVKAFDLERES